MTRYTDHSPAERREYQRLAAMRSWHRHRVNPEWRARKARLRLEKFRARKIALVTLLGGCCGHCGFSSHIAALDFHHRDPSLKSFDIGPLIAQRPWSVLVAEAGKCDLLCSNCHRILHWGENA